MMVAGITWRSPLGSYNLPNILSCCNVLIRAITARQRSLAAQTLLILPFAARGRAPLLLNLAISSTSRLVSGFVVDVRRRRPRLRACRCSWRMQVRTKDVIVLTNCALILRKTVDGALDMPTNMRSSGVHKHVHSLARVL